MLVVMTFEVGLLFSATIGLGLGNFITSKIKLPELPNNTKWSKKRGDYEPNPDPCCSKVEYLSPVIAHSVEIAPETLEMAMATPAEKSKDLESDREAAMD